MSAASTMRDAIVIGAGPAGAAAAHALARAGRDVVLVDRARFPRDKTCGDGLTPRALAVMEDMGALPEALALGRRAGGFSIASPGGTVVEAPIRESVVAPDHLAPRIALPGGLTTGHALTGHALPGYALVVPRLLLDDLLRERAVAAGSEWRDGAEVLSVATRGEGVEVTARRDGREETWRARTAVLATGAATGLLRRIGVLAESPPMVVAARAYFEGVALGAADRLALRFDGVPLPGYGWVFPTSSTSANVGAGYFGAGWWRWRARTARGAYAAFIRTPVLRRMLEGARRVGPVRGYPLRTDFGAAPTSHGRVLLAGEAAGLVNPLTGEGIDYALESGQLAGEHLAGALAGAGCTPVAAARYDALLAERFAALFGFCATMRRWCVNRPVLDALVRLARRREDLRTLLIDVVLGGRPVRGPLTVRRALRRIFAT
jgi:geranylgeranyl reductase family protein